MRCCRYEAPAPATFVLRSDAHGYARSAKAPLSAEEQYSSLPVRVPSIALHEGCHVLPPIAQTMWQIAPSLVRTPLARQAPRSTVCGTVEHFPFLRYRGAARAQTRGS